MLGISRRPTGREWRRVILVFIVGVAALLFAMVVLRPQPQLLPLGTTPPVIQLSDDAGTTVSVPSIAAGRPLVVEFFATSCPVCQHEAISVCDVAQRHPRAQVVAVEAEGHSPSEIHAFRQQYAPQCSFPQLVDPQSSAAHSWSVNVVPTVYVLDSSGKITYAGSGADGVAGLDAALVALHV